jgi:hypothetical protein
MRSKNAKQFITLSLCALALSACASRHDVPISSAGDDDDAFCRANNVAVGSPEYVACRKDRDVQRLHAEEKADRAQRNLGEYMLNHPDHP